MRWRGVRHGPKRRCREALSRSDDYGMSLVLLLLCV